MYIQTLLFFLLKAMILGLKNSGLKPLAGLFGYSLLLAHFFIALGRDDAFWGLFWQAAYYQDLFFVAIIVFIVSVLIHSVWAKLNQRCPWQQNLRKRLILQIFAGVLLPALLSILFVYLYMHLVLNQDIKSTSYFYYELPVSLLIILMINLVLGLQYAIGHQKKTAEPVPSAGKNPVMVQSGNIKILLDPEHVSFVEKEASLCFVYTQNKTKYIYPNSLDQLSQQLQQDFFFRTNRQTIIHRSNCLSFETERSGKLILTLHHPVAKKVTVSQKKARQFKAWLRSNL